MKRELQRDRPLISVMIGAYNAAPYLGEAIESVLSQTYRRFELIVVDDGSTDETPEIVRRFGDTVIYEHQQNAGNGAARNRAAQLASGSLLAFLDADDRFALEKLDRQHTALVTQPAADMVFGHVREFVSPELTTQERRAVRAPAPKPMPWTAPNLMLIRRESFLQVGPFSETLRVGVTVDWYARAIECGLSGIMLPDVVLERRLHLANNGIRERDARNQYLQVLKSSLDRRRAAETGSGHLEPK
jgi:glycosyltransferase involved in cell wall biosynthesis